ncbi:TadE family protein [Nocardioides perillae]|uniref:Flp pilus assembly protein TadG n=1 Tax=Nocardioides perillae TaxID=1119534 RepID=A0A7Y9RW94_9ACTN|nr:Flp pilus assembly protein TadG [Nocardioides perillae]
MELVLYTPLLMFVIFLAVQFVLVYLGNQAASAVAREASRVARTTQSEAEAQRAGRQLAENIGQGVLEDYDITIRLVGDERVRVTVTGRAQEISPVGVPRVSQSVEGPIERFVGGP